VVCRTNARQGPDRQPHTRLSYPPALPMASRWHTRIGARATRRGANHGESGGNELRRILVEPPEMPGGMKKPYTILGMV